MKGVDQCLMLHLCYKHSKWNEVTHAHVLDVVLMHLTAGKKNLVLLEIGNAMEKCLLLVNKLCIYIIKKRNHCQVGAVIPFEITHCFLIFC